MLPCPQETYGGNPELFCAFPVQSEQKPTWVQPSRAAWNEDEKVLTLYVCPGAHVRCGEIRFSFLVQNAALPQTAPCNARAHREIAARM